MAPYRQQIIALLAVNLAFSIAGFVPEFPVDSTSSLTRIKRMLTTICVEIKPSSAQEEPYFMCKGTDLPTVRPEIHHHHDNSKIKPFEPQLEQDPVPFSKLNSSIASSTPTPYDPFTSSQHESSTEKYQIETKPRPADVAEDKYSMPQQVQQSFGTKKDFFQDLPKYQPPKAFQLPMAVAGLQPSNARPSPLSSSATSGQTLPYYNQPIPSPYAAIFPARRPQMSINIEGAGASNPSYSSSLVNDSPNVPAAFNHYYQPNSFVYEQAIHQAPPSQSGRPYDYRNSFEPIETRKTIPTGPGRAPAVPAADPSEDDVMGKPNAKKYNGGPKASPLSDARYRAIDEAVLGEPDWNFSPEEFGQLRSLTMNRVPSQQPQMRFRNYKDDPVMAAFYASLPDNLQQTYMRMQEPSLGAPHVNSQASEEENLKKLQSPVKKNLLHQGPQSNSFNQVSSKDIPNPMQRTFGSTQYDMCTRQMPSQYVQPQCNRGFPSYQPVLIVLPCFEPNSPALVGSPPESNEMVGSSLLPPLFGPFSHLGFPFATSLFSPPPLFPLLAMSNPHTGYTDSNRMPPTQARSSSDAVLGAVALPETEHISSSPKTITAPTTQRSTQTNIDASLESSEEYPSTAAVKETTESEELFNDSQMSKSKSTKDQFKIGDETISATSEKPLYADDLPSTTNIEPETKKTYKMLLGAAKQFATIANAEVQGQTNGERTLDKRQNPINSTLKRKYAQQQI